MSERDAFVIGADGCRGNATDVDAWACVRIFADARIDAFVAGSTRELWEIGRSAAMIAVDVPIGLPERGSREVDVAARGLLGPRRASVFPAPERWMLSCANVADADRERARRERRRVKVQRQMWNIVPRIRAVDELLQRDLTARAIVREAHPELCFRMLAGRPMEHAKRTSAGADERLAVLQRFHAEVGAIAAELCRAPGVQRDDAIDALVCAITAAAVLPSPGRVLTLPESPPKDSTGLPMEMVYRVG